MFYGDSNVQLGGEILIIGHSNISVIRGVEHTVYLFFNDVSKIPVLNQVITAHKAIYKYFGVWHISQISLNIKIKIVWISQ